MGATTIESPIKRAAKYLLDPVLFARHVLKDDTWPLQEEIMRSVASRTRTAVRSCHSSGKTYTLAQIVLWWLVRWPDAVAVTTAPTDRQVEKLLWGEIHKAIARCPYPLFPNANLTELRVGPGNYAIGFATDKRGQGVRFQGFHAGHLLVILDEAQGVSPEVWEAVEGVAASGHVRVVAISNPIIPGGPFYDAFTSDRERWNTITINGFDTPNFKDFTLERLRLLPRGLAENDPVFLNQPRPYLLGRRWVYDAFWKYGELSPFWQSRVLGDFPTQAEDALISLAWIEAARDRVLAGDDDRRLYAGIDVAAGGADETVCVVRTEKGRVLEWGSWYGHSTGPVIDFLRPYKERLEEINYDSAGPGEYFDTALENARFPNLNPVNVGEASDFPERFQNLKAHLYWILRERFKEGSVSGIDDELMISQLASLRFEINPRGRVEMESKAEMKKRGLKSPDRAEALMLAFSNQTPAMLEYIQHKVEREQRQVGHDRAVIEARTQGKPPPEPAETDGDDVEDLIDVYNRTYYASDPDNVCNRCGGTCLACRAS